MTKWALNKTLASLQSAQQLSLLILLEGGWRPPLAEFGGSLTRPALSWRACGWEVRKNTISEECEEGSVRGDCVQGLGQGPGAAR